MLGGPAGSDAAQTVVAHSVQRPPLTLSIFCKDLLEPVSQNLIAKKYGLDSNGIKKRDTKIKQLRQKRKKI